MIVQRIYEGYQSLTTRTPCTAKGTASEPSKRCTTEAVLHTRSRLSLLLPVARGFEELAGEAPGVMNAAPALAKCTVNLELIGTTEEIVTTEGEVLETGHR